MALRLALSDLFREELDTDVLDYLEGIIIEHDDDDGSIEDIWCAISSF
jgi:hypothetical protein